MEFSLLPDLFNISTENRYITNQNSNSRLQARNNIFKLHLGGNKLNIQNHQRRCRHHYESGMRSLSIRILQTLPKYSKVELTQY